MSDQVLAPAPAESATTSLDMSTGMISHPVRETPAPEPLHSGLDDPAHTVLLPEEMNSSPLEMNQIQGNILGGFNKDFQAFLFLRIDRADAFQAWLGTQIDHVATSEEVVAFNRLFKAIRYRRGKETNAVKSTWFNIAFSYEGLTALQSAIPNLLGQDFTDSSFKAGLARNSTSLGDPTDATQEGHPDNWVVGGTRNAAHVLLQIASDDHEDLTSEVTRLEDSLYAISVVNGRRVDSGATILYKQNGANLSGAMAGHEHFGFLDGISQPGIRGLVSKDPHDVLTLRQNPLKRDQITPQGKRVTAQGKPGQDLLWAGEFVFGYPTQTSMKPDENAIDGPNPAPGPIAEAGPAWAKNGSFLVFRRLRQDVFAFHSFLKHIGDNPNYNTDIMTVGAQLVGRWQSGAPVMRAAAKDNSALGNADCANNNFEFGGKTDALPDAAANDPFACTDDIPKSAAPAKFHASQGDKEGTLCPFTSHIRKSYPRDDEAISSPPVSPYSNLPGANPLQESDTQTHRLLRRGIPFGERSASTPLQPTQDSVDRGLLFFAYQTSIVRQFEFVTIQWVNNKNFKEPFGTEGDAPNLRGGHDPIIGQNNQDPERVREFTLIDAGHCPFRVTTHDFQYKDWVIPTGGGYFFAPSIAALELLAGTGSVA